VVVPPLERPLGRCAALLDRLFDPLHEGVRDLGLERLTELLSCLDRDLQFVSNVFGDA
jgi:hypothetical protein